MDYNKTIDFLYHQLPMFQRIGGAAYKAGLETSILLDNLFQCPHTSFKTIHVAGTNGKGSVSHTLASILQKSGYKVGLYTSPHLIDFRERIRVNGEMITKDYVVDFVHRYLDLKFDKMPSFFELTMMMAFDYFRTEKVDIAVIEVGLGGRLDSTNIISPILSIITNISFDHTQFLGNTLPLIANEKAGIIKAHTPVVIGEAIGDVRKVFEDKAKSVDAPICFAEDNPCVKSFSHSHDMISLETTGYGTVIDELSGDCQLKNANTILTALPILSSLGLTITPQAVKNGFKNVCEISGLMGRWMLLQSSPRTICDTGHNVGGIRYIVDQLKREQHDKLRIVIGFVNDKDISHILDMFPHDAVYYFTQAAIPRALDCKNLAAIASLKGLDGRSFNSVAEAYSTALKESATTDMIYIGGSTFIVADLLSFLKGQQ